MQAEWIPVVVGLTALTASLMTAAVNVFFSERWKARYARAKEAEDRAQALLDRYREPLARSAFDLQSKLYNMVRRSAVPGHKMGGYAELSTLWLIGQWCAWNEILRREIQLLDLGSPAGTAILQRKLMDIADVFASTSISGRDFRVRRAEQRAIGELLVVDRVTSAGSRSDAIGYAEFCAKVDTPELEPWLRPLQSAIRKFYDEPDGYPPRLVLLQRQLVELIDYLDPDRVRFPDRNDRGKLPRPTAGVDPKRSRPAWEIARFRFVPSLEPDPCDAILMWLRTLENVYQPDTAVDENGVVTARFRPHRFSRLWCYLVVRQAGGRQGYVWVEIEAWLQSRVAITEGEKRQSLESTAPRWQRVRRRSVSVINNLLDLLGRPSLHADLPSAVVVNELHRTRTNT
ncbi:hypothetical protein [Nocardia alni]|uniref:hypothetical protein n=1 Tax=Nocardia alni TaxID=2815723 RepID=UPI001C244119|nr:hypothetical protein [Nocardia alni]